MEEKVEISFCTIIICKEKCSEQTLAAINKSKIEKTEHLAVMYSMGGDVRFLLEEFHLTEEEMGISWIDETEDIIGPGGFEDRTYSPVPWLRVVKKKGSQFAYYKP